VNLIRDNDRMRQRLAELSDQKREMDDRATLLIEEKQTDKETIEQLHVQLHELNEISHNLKLEMEAYDRLVKQFGIDRFNENNKKVDNDKSDKALLTALLEEIRDLRQQLTISMDANIALKEKLEKELGRPVSISPLMDTTNLTTTAATTPFKDPTMSAKRSLFSAVLHSVSIADGRHGDGDDNDGGVGTTRQNKKKGSVHFSPFETPTRDYGTSSRSFDDNSNNSDVSSSTHSTSSRHQQHNNSNSDHHDKCQLLGTWSNYRIILDDIKDAVSLIVTLQKRVTTMKTSSRDNLKQPQLLHDLSGILKKVKEAGRFLNSFVPQDDKQNGLVEENSRLQKSITSLKKTLKSKEYFIKSAVDMVEENAKMRGHTDKENSSSRSLTKKLMKTRDTLKATRGTMEIKSKKAQEKASLDLSFVSSSPSTSFEELVTSPPS